MSRVLLTASAVLAAAAFAAPQASALTLTGVGTYKGNAGIGAPNGVVTASPVGSSYVYVSTAGGVSASDEGIGLGQGNESNGSELTTFAFGAAAGDVLSYYFNYVTSDGSGFADYAYAFLLNTDTSDQTLIFTARTTPTDDTVPGFGLPGIDAGVTLDPASSAIIGGGPSWAQLGDSSGECFNGVGNGCGYTGWILSSFTIPTAGNYQFVFGVVNWDDTAFDSGLAVAGLRVGDTDIIPPDVGGPSVVPVPAAAPLLLTGLGVFAWMRRRRRAA